MKTSLSFLEKGLALHLMRLLLCYHGRLRQIKGGGGGTVGMCLHSLTLLDNP